MPSPYDFDVDRRPQTRSTPPPLPTHSDQPVPLTSQYEASHHHAPSIPHARSGIVSLGIFGVGLLTLLAFIYSVAIIPEEQAYVEEFSDAEINAAILFGLSAFTFFVGGSTALVGCIQTRRKKVTAAVGLVINWIACMAIFGLMFLIVMLPE